MCVCGCVFVYLCVYFNLRVSLNSIFADVINVVTVHVITRVIRRIGPSAIHKSLQEKKKGKEKEKGEERIKKRSEGKEGE